MIVVTGATGHLGRLAIEHLLDRGVPARDIAAVVRTPAKAADLAERGVDVRRADYEQPETLTAALAGADTLLFVSASEVGKRVAQHTNVVEAAVGARVGHVVYTSLLRADSSGIGLATEHLATEKLIRDSGLPYTFLRNGWYLENYTEHLDGVLPTGVLLRNAGSGRVSAAARTDYAEAAAIVATTDGHTGRIYELAGDTGFDYADLAAAISRHSGTAVRYSPTTAADHISALTRAGAPGFLAELMADWDAGIARGDLESTSDDLHRLIGRDTTPLDTAVAAALDGSR